MILAHAECDYKRPVRYGEMLDIHLRIVELGRTSFRYEYDIVDAEQRAVATARTVQVMFDYETERPMPIPAAVRELLTTASTREE